eukprot:PhM_4_TR15323/c0_g1_i1/m.23877
MSSGPTTSTVTTERMAPHPFLLEAFLSKRYIMSAAITATLTFAANIYIDAAKFTEPQYRLLSADVVTNIVIMCWICCFIEVGLNNASLTADIAAGKVAPLAKTAVTIIPRSWLRFAQRSRWHCLGFLMAFSLVIPGCCPTLWALWMVCRDEVNDDRACTVGGEEFLHITVLWKVVCALVVMSTHFVIAIYEKDDGGDAAASATQKDEKRD